MSNEELDKIVSLSEEQKTVLNYLEVLSCQPCNPMWTEGHWREANEVLLRAKIAFGLDSWEDVHDRSR